MRWQTANSSGGLNSGLDILEYATYSYWLALQQSTDLCDSDAKSNDLKMKLVYLKAVTIQVQSVYVN